MNTCQKFEFENSDAHHFCMKCGNSLDDTTFQNPSYTDLSPCPNPNIQVGSVFGGQDNQTLSCKDIKKHATCHLNLISLSCIIPIKVFQKNNNPFYNVHPWYSEYCTTIWQKK